MTGNKIFVFSISIIIIIICLELLTKSLFFILDRDIKAYQYYPGRYKNSKDLGYELTPDWELDHYNLHEKINSSGFRSPEIDQKKPDNNYRIIITGSSIVFGRTSNSYTISHLLEKKLNKVYGKTKKIEVINAGVPGYNTFHILKQFKIKLKQFSPDLIIHYQFFTDLSIIDFGNESSLTGYSYNPNNTTFVKNNLKSFIDKSYLLTMVKAAYRISSINRNNQQFQSIAKGFTVKDSLEIIINKQYEIYQQLNFFKQNLHLLANECNKIDADLILCIPISLYKPFNTPDEINLIDNYDSKDYILNSIGTGNNIIKEISTVNSNTFYFDISKNIKSDISLFDDKYHTLEKGNNIISEELKNYIVRNKFKKN